MTSRGSGSRRVRVGVAGLAAAALVALTVAGCSHELSALDYDMSCTKDSDCVAIQEGAVANCCGFNNCGDNAAINKADFQQYLSDYKAEAGSCAGRSCPNIECMPPQVTCAPFPGHRSCAVLMIEP